MSQNLRRPLARLLAMAAPLVLIATVTTGCFGARTQLAPVDRREVQAEEQFQSALYWQVLAQQQQRLSRVTYELLRAATPLCGSLVNYDLGFRVVTLNASNGRLVEGSGRSSRRQAERLVVVGVRPGSAAEQAGLRDGDEVYALGRRTLRKNDRLSPRLETWSRELERSSDGVVSIGVERTGSRVPVMFRAERICYSPAYVVEDAGLNAFANGRLIGVTTTMMRFVDDDELAAIVAHELAHNIMDHSGSKAGNMAAGSLWGALGDVVLAMFGVNSQGYYTRAGAQAGAQANSQDFEREADYVGMYLLARAGRPLDRAMDLWRHMAIANPGAIAYAGSHPTSAERFVRLRQAAAEIEAKRQSGALLAPNMRQIPRDRTRSSAPAQPAVALTPLPSPGTSSNLQKPTVPHEPAALPESKAPLEETPPAPAAKPATEPHRTFPPASPQTQPAVPASQPSAPTPPSPATPEVRRRAPGRPPGGNGLYLP